MEAISFGDATCEVCLQENGIFRDYVVDIDMIRGQLQRFGDDRRADGGRQCAEASVSSTYNCNWNVRPKYSALNCFNFTMP